MAASSGEPPCVVFCGDMNADIRDTSVWEGTPHVAPGAESLTVPKINTGYAQESGVGVLRWGGIRLLDAFEAVHRGGAGVGTDAGGRCTSRNAERCEWIDMMWYSPQSLLLDSQSENLSPTEPMPNAEEPSDHMPITASFRLVPSL